MDFVIAIPSYQRPKKLRDQTLAFLAREEFCPDKIFVFVASQEEKNSYQEVLTPGTFREIIVGVPGLSQQRNFITKFFPNKTRVLTIDDDIKRIKFLKPRPVKDLVVEMFQLCDKEKASLWSIYPVNNLFFCKDRVLVGKLFCVHCFCGYINDHSIEVIASCVDDKYRSLVSYLKDGKVLRYDGACPDTTYNAAGGLTEHRALHRTQEVREVVKTFPDHCSIRKRKNGIEEVHWRPITLKQLSLSSIDDRNQIHEGKGRRGQEV